MLIDGAFGVVGHELYELKCYSCKHISCKHKQYLLDFDHFDPVTLSIVIELFDQQKKIRIKKTKKSISTKTISFLMQDELKTLIRKRPIDHLKIISDSNLELVDYAGSCDCSGQLEKVGEGREIKLFHREDAYDAVGKYFSLWVIFHLHPFILASFSTSQLH